MAAKPTEWVIKFARPEEEDVQAFAAELGMRAGEPMGSGLTRLSKYTKLYSLHANKDEAHDTSLAALVASGRLAFAEKQVAQQRVLR